jgi:kynurenine formamidase
MGIIDLTHPLPAGVSVYPGDKAPVFARTATIADDGYQASELCLGTHTGTHLDAPAHLLPGGKTIDQFPASHFLGRALVIDCRDLPGVISRRHLEARARPREAEFILLLTGWDRYWGTAAYLRGFPVLSPAAAAWLASFSLKGIGLDAISIDPLDSTKLPNHRCFLEQGMVIIENLTNLAALPGVGCQLSCLPLLITGSDAAPARVVATVPA